MRPAVTFVVAALWSVSACERSPATQPHRTAKPPNATATERPAPEPTLAPTPAPVEQPADELVEAAKPAISVPARQRPLAHSISGPRRGPPPRVVAPLPHSTAPGDLPLPPGDDPAVYATWLRDLPRVDQKRIARFCRSRPVDYELACGGIGPLHIPLPPRVGVRQPQPGDPRSPFATMEDWQGSLTRAQLAYVDRACPGHEDQESSALCGDNTPLVVAFDTEPITFTMGGSFAFAPGRAVASDWPTASTPWIALDRDGDGVIASGAELFGNHTPMADGVTPTNGFEALAALDANHDGRIDASDPAFGSLLLWADGDGDRRGTRAELSPLANVIISISLAHRVELRCDARHNCEGERATFTWRDATGALREGAVVDIYLPSRPER